MPQPQFGQGFANFGGQMLMPENGFQSQMGQPMFAPQQYEGQGYDHQQPAYDQSHMWSQGADQQMQGFQPNPMQQQQVQQPFCITVTESGQQVTHWVQQLDSSPETSNAIAEAQMKGSQEILLRLSEEQKLMFVADPSA